MSAYKSCLGALRAGTPKVTIGEVTSWTLEESANVKTYFKLGDCNEQNVAGGITRSLSIEANYDPTDTGQDEVDIIGQSVEVEIYPIGEDSTNEFFTATGVVETKSITGSGDDFVTMSLSIKVSNLVRAVVP